MNKSSFTQTSVFPPDEAERNKIALAGCCHCGQMGFVRRHGFLKGQSFTLIRGWRFLCSNRNSNGGCGRSFSVLFNERVARCSVNTDELYSFFKLLITHKTVTAAWRAALLVKFPLSLSSAYRWLRLFKQHIHFYRSKLFEQVRPPPMGEKEIASPNHDIATTIRMFDEARLYKTQNSFAAFQLHHQAELY